MKTRQLGKNGPEITTIGLGTWAIGGPWMFGWGAQDDDDSIKTIRAALSTGVNYIDTAPAYGLGHAEEIVARAIENERKNIILATKCGLVWDANGKIKRNNHPDSIRKECEDSLTRLKTDYIDLYQIHWPDPGVPVEDSWGEMIKLKEEGKVRYIGVSNYDQTMLSRSQKLNQVQSLQPPYSLIKRDIEEKILPWCRENETGVIAYSPMQAGLLTGKFSAAHLSTLPQDDWRRKDPFFKEPYFSKSIKLVEKMKGLAKEMGVEVSQLALAWVIAQPGITSAIAGARSRSQAEKNSQAADILLDPVQVQQLDNFFKEEFE